MQKSLTITALFLAVSPLLAAPPPKASPVAAKPPTASSSVEPKTEEEKTTYAIGLVISRNLGPFTLSDHELELVKAGLADGVHHTPKVAIDVYGPKVNELAKKRSEAAAATEKKAGEGFLA